MKIERHGAKLDHKLINLKYDESVKTDVMKDGNFHKNIKDINDKT